MNSPRNPKNLIALTRRVVFSQSRMPRIVMVMPMAQATRDRRDPTTERIMLLKLRVTVTPLTP